MSIGGETRTGLDWFEVGAVSFREGARDAGCLPPLNDMEAQRWWLGGFGAAWVEHPDDGESVDEALAQILEGRADLLRQLRSHRLGWGSRTVH
jgi:hypothetical protein